MAIAMGSVPVGVQCPLTSSLREFLGYWPGSGTLGYRPCWCPTVHRLSLRLPYLSVFPFTIHMPLDFISDFPLRGRICTNSVDPSLTHFLGEFQAWDWLWYPMLWFQRRSMECTGSRNLVSNCCPSQGLNLGPLNLEPLMVTTRLRYTPPFSRLLRHAGEYSRTILTPYLQG